MSIDVAPAMFRSLTLKNGQREDTVGGRRYRVSTDHNGRTVIGPVRHRKASRKGIYMAMMTGGPNDLTARISNVMRMATSPLPPPQKRSLWSRFKDRCANGWDRLTDPDWHRLMQHIALDVLLWALAAGVVGMVARVLVWAWS